MKQFAFAAAAVAGMFVAMGSASAQDVAAGEKSFAKCRACHQVGEKARNGVGPKLNGLFGRVAGTVEGYNYSAANKNSGITWTEENFGKYIQNPRGFMPGNKMAFAGIKNETEVANLTAYLKQFDAEGKKSGS